MTGRALCTSSRRAPARAPRLGAVAAVAAAILGGACTLFRPAQVTPPTAPPTFELAPRSAQAQAAAGSAASPDADGERATEGAVWWSAFADPALDRAIQEALRNNYFIRDIRTLITENALDPTVPRGWLWPLQIGIPSGTPAGIQNVAIGSAPVPPTDALQLKYNSANINVTASYQLDLWGELDARRRVGDDLVEQQRQSTETFAHTLAEQVTQLWFDILVERAAKELIEGDVRYNEALFDLVKARFDQHLVNRLAVLQQEQRLLSVRAQVPLIAARIAQLNSQLTALMGRLPNPNDELVPADRRLPDLPPAPALGTPSRLTEAAPELRFARLRVTEIENRINQNRASWLPNIELLGRIGVISYELGEPLRESFAGIRLSWPLFDGGHRITEAKQLDLTLKRRKWQYELALKTAVGRVQDALIQENNQAESLRNLRAQVELGRRLLDEARRIFEQGQSDYLPVLNALGNLAALERDGLRAQRLLLSYRVQLYRALGGTWSDAVSRLPN